MRVFLPVHRLQFPTRFVRFNFHRAGGARVNHGNFFLLQPFAQGAARAARGGKFRVRDDDDARLDRVNQRVAQRLAFRRQAGDYDVGAQIIGGGDMTSFFRAG